MKIVQSKCCICEIYNLFLGKSFAGFHFLYLIHFFSLVMALLESMLQLGDQQRSVLRLLFQIIALNINADTVRRFSLLTHLSVNVSFHFTALAVFQ